MSRPAILNVFASHAFLARLSDHCLMELATGVRPFAVAGGGYLTRKGDEARAFYLVQAGTVLVGAEIHNDELQPLWSVGPGGVIGWSWLIPPHKWNFTCKAETPVRGLMFDAAWLRERCEANHELGYHLLKEMVASLAGQFLVPQGTPQLAPAGGESEWTSE